MEKESSIKSKLAMKVYIPKFVDAFFALLSMIYIFGIIPFGISYDLFNKIEYCFYYGAFAVIAIYVIIVSCIDIARPAILVEGDNNGIYINRLHKKVDFVPYSDILEVKGNISPGTNYHHYRLSGSLKIYAERRTYRVYHVANVEDAQQSINIAIQKRM